MTNDQQKEAPPALGVASVGRFNLSKTMAAANRSMEGNDYRYQTSDRKGECLPVKSRTCHHSPNDVVRDAHAKTK
jgi:hypothetical protein